LPLVAEQGGLLHLNRNEGGLNRRVFRQGGERGKRRAIMANPIPLGSDFLVNTTTNGWQGTSAAAPLANGNFVVAWADESRQPTPNDYIRCQLFDPNGNKIGPERYVAYPWGYYSQQQTQLLPSIAGLASGGFV
jgi:hypothetical protein